MPRPARTKNKIVEYLKQNAGASISNIDRDLEDISYGNISRILSVMKREGEALNDSGKWFYQGPYESPAQKETRKEKERTEAELLARTPPFNYYFLGEARTVEQWLQISVAATPEAMGEMLSKIMRAPYTIAVARLQGDASYAYTLKQDMDRRMADFHTWLSMNLQPAATLADNMLKVEDVSKYLELVINQLQFNIAREQIKLGNEGIHVPEENYDA